MSTPEELEQNIKAYEAMREMLEEHHLYKFVVFHDTKFIGAFDSFHNAAREAIRRFRQGPYLIRQVGAPKRIAMPASAAFRPGHATR